MLRRRIAFDGLPIRIGLAMHAAVFRLLTARAGCGAAPALCSSPSMLQPREERRAATVTAVHAYGLDIDVQGRLGFIQPTELDWGCERRPEHFSVGDRVEVIVYAETPDRCYASIKRTSPDPWDPDVFAVGTRHRGRVDRVVEWGASVLLRPGVWGMILTSDTLFVVGDEVDIEVVEIDSELRKLALKAIPVESQ